jgi:hypothetical protein
MNLFGLLVLVAASLMVLGNSAARSDYGSFVGDVVATFLPDGRRMQLTADFAYLDPSGKRWDAPKDSIIDGASIPQVFWSLVGGPFEGQYRNASVVHDMACDGKSERWQDVHRMFYFAMRAGGVSERRAALMYAAVYRFGPRWEEPKGFWGKIGEGLKSVFGVFTREEKPPPPPPPPPVTEADVKALETLIEENNPKSPEEVERLLR